MLDATRPRNVRDVDQPVDAILNFDEGAKVSQIAHPPMHARSHLIAVGQSGPGIFLDLFHAETYSSALGIDTQHFDIDDIARVDDLTRMLHPLGPAHL